MVWNPEKGGQRGQDGGKEKAERVTGTGREHDQSRGKDVATEGQSSVPPANLGHLVGREAAAPGEGCQGRSSQCSEQEAGHGAREPRELCGFQKHNEGFPGASGQVAGSGQEKTQQMIGVTAQQRRLPEGRAFT